MQRHCLKGRYDETTLFAYASCVVLGFSSLVVLFCDNILTVTCEARRRGAKFTPNQENALTTGLIQPDSGRGLGSSQTELQSPL